MAKEPKKEPKKKAKRLVHLFIDDSNIFIEGQRTAEFRNATDDTARDRFRINYGKLIEWVVGDDRELKSVYLVGSRPPSVDAFWDHLRKHGIEPVIFDRQAGREKGVDHDLVAEMIETSILAKKDDGVIALVAGDGDYRSTLDRLTKKDWELEVYFWTSGCSSLIRDTPWYINLDPHFTDLSFFERRR